MAVYKLFAEKDATIYSEYETLNSGMDEILELTKKESLLYPTTSTTCRSLLKFSQEDIDSVMALIGASSFDVYLKLYYADIGEIPVHFVVSAYPIAEDWDMGTGRSGNIPITTNGVCWKYRTADTGSYWTTGSYGAGITGSYLIDNTGGGTWYVTGSATQSFDQYTEKDICIKVTDFIHMFASGTIENYGFIVMNSGSIEFDVDQLYKLTYFSRDTNTIYPPVLEFRWDDSQYITGSVVNSSNMYVVLSNNYVEFKDDAIHRFRLSARDKFPTRTFTTSSLFTSTKLLPSSSYYSIRDAKTNDVIIDFDDNYTKISSDGQGNYFDLYMNGLEPERYYRILIKTIVDSSTIILDDQYFFKVEE